MSTTTLFESIALGSVRGSIIQRELENRGIPWQEAGHIAATAWLTKAILEDEGLSIPLATLTDLVVLSPESRETGLKIDTYPRPREFVDRERYAAMSRDWQETAAHFRMQQGIQFGQKLREYRAGHASQAKECTLLMHSRREYFSAVQTLISSGIQPDQRIVKTYAPIEEVALECWEWIESKMPSLSWPRQDLWSSWSEAGPVDADLVRRLRLVLAHVFGARDRWTLVYHGFYFYTPPQWALFQILRRTGFVDQVFIVHDDGRSRVFETWRRFFSKKWNMPEPSYVDAREDPTLAAQALSAAFQGDTISEESKRQLVIQQFGSPAEFVREGLYEDMLDGQRDIYAADHAAMGRYCRRLSPADTTQNSSLSQLPIGAFLLRLHECIEERAAGVRFVLSPDSLLDIIGSGALKLQDTDRTTFAFQAAVKRALGYFSDCDEISDWAERAQQLEDIVKGPVGLRGARDDRVNDLERLRSAVGNPLRLVPWLDITPEEASSIKLVILQIQKLLQELAEKERISFATYATFLHRQIRDSLENLPKAERDAIESKLSGFSIGLDGEIDVTGLLEVVRILLGREPTFTEIEEVSDQSAVKPLRSLDQLGYKRSKRSIHIANLADGAFPSYVPAIGWPFHREQLVGGEEGSKEILVARSQYAQLSDLYLVWLALDGVDESAKVQLSWIAELGGELRNPAAVLSMLMVPDVRNSWAIKERAGGIGVTKRRSVADVGSLFQQSRANALATDDVTLDEAIGRVPREATAASLACPRRFAIQWSLGPTHSFAPNPMLARLYGNMVAALKNQGMTEQDAFRLCNRIWPHLTPAERASSFYNARTHQTKPEWLYTLRGSKDGRDPIDLAYRAAFGDIRVPSSAIRSEVNAFLPSAPADRSKVCPDCPVQHRCRFYSRDEA